tara:strand:+ start:47 stop:667 length:621 start_codon:yes stop_codon:yes gene_type:complete
MKQQLLLNEAAEYNDVIDNVFGKLSFARYRNNFELFWVRGAQILKDQIEKLLEIEGWTKSEKEFLKLIKELIIAKLEKKNLIILSLNEIKDISGLSIDVMIERDQLVQEAIMDKEIEGESFDLKEILFLLDMDARLLKLVKDKLMNDEVDAKDISNLKNISFSLVKVYLFLADFEVTKDQLKDSMLTIKEIWREYHPISTLTVHNA